MAAASIDVINELEAIQDELEHWEDVGDLAERHACDRRFHLFIVGISGNAEAIHLVERQHNFIAAHLMKYGQTEARHQQVRKEHRAQITALRSGDAAAAAKAAILHVANARKDIVAMIRRAKA